MKLELRKIARKVALAQILNQHYGLGYEDMERSKEGIRFNAKKLSPKDVEGKLEIIEEGNKNFAPYSKYNLGL